MALDRAKKYVKNSQKELGELLQASQDYRNVKGDKSSDEMKKKKKFQNERGQWVGAVLQGRRYDSNGKLIKDKPTASKTSTKVTPKKTAKKKMGK